MKRPVNNPFTDYLFNKAWLKRIPISGTFELTPVCNMNCKMCYVRKSKKEQESEGNLLSSKQWLSIAEAAKQQGLLYLLLTGGEPFLYPEIKPLLQELNKMGFIISINTNGTMIDEEIVAWLKECPPEKINITMYGGSNETYEKLCNNPNGYDQMVNAVKLLKSNGMNVKLNCSLTPLNISDLPMIKKFASENDLILEAATYMFPPVRKSINNVGQNFRLSSNEAAKYKAINYLDQYGSDEFLRSAEQLRLIENNTDCINENDSSESADRHMRCGAGKNSFWINWKGDLLGCGMIPISNTNVLQDDFGTAWKKTQKWIDEILLPVKCMNCADRKSCGACPASIFAETGSFDKVPEYQCQSLEALKQNFHQISDDIKQGKIKNE